MHPLSLNILDELLGLLDAAHDSNVTVLSCGDGRPGERGADADL